MTPHKQKAEKKIIKNYGDLASVIQMIWIVKNCSRWIEWYPNGMDVGFSHNKSMQETVVPVIFSGYKESRVW